MCIRDRSYVPPFQLDQPMDGAAVGTVEQVGDGAIDGNGSPLAIGDTVIHGLGWRTRSLVHGKTARILNTSVAPAQAYLGVLGMPGLTAYVGLLRIGEFADAQQADVGGQARHTENAEVGLRRRNAGVQDASG